MTELQIFREADANMNGILSYTELVDYGNRMKKPTLAQDWMKKFDLRNKGYLTVDDLESVLKTQADADYLRHLTAKQLSQSVIMSAHSQLYTEKLKEKITEMPFFFNAQTDEFLVDGKPMGKTKDLILSSRIEYCSKTDFIFFDGKKIGELDLRYKATRVEMDTNAGVLIVDGYPHGTLADMFYSDCLVLGKTRSNYELCVAYSFKQDQLYINGRNVGKLDELYVRKQIFFNMGKSTLNFYDIEIGYVPAQVKELKDEKEKINLNGVTKLLSEHVSKETVVMYQPGLVKNLGIMSVEGHDATVSLNDKKLGSVDELLGRGEILIRDDRILTYKGAEIGCFDDQVPSGKLAYNKDIGKITVNSLTLCSAVKMLRKHQIILTGYNIKKPKLHLPKKDKDEVLYCDRVKIEHFKAVVEKNRLRINAAQEAIFLDDLNVGALPHNYGQYGVRFDINGHLDKNTTSSAFMNLYEAGSIIHQEEKKEARRVTIVPNGDVFLDGGKAGTVADLLKSGDLLVDESKNAILLKGIFVCSVPEKILQPNDGKKFQTAPKEFLDLYKYSTSVRICAITGNLFEDGFHCDSIEEEIQEGHITYNASNGQFLHEKDALAQVRNGIPASTCSLKMGTGLVTIGGQPKKLESHIKSGDVRLLGLPFPLDLDSQNQVYKNNVLMTTLENCIKEGRVKVKENVIYIDNIYLCHADTKGLKVTPDSVVETSTPVAQINDLFARGMKSFFRPLAPVTSDFADIQEEEKPAVVRAAPPSSPPSTPVKVTFSINDKNELLFGSKNLGKVETLIKNGDVKVRFPHGDLVHKGDKICKLPYSYFAYIGGYDHETGNLISTNNIKSSLLALRFNSIHQAVTRGTDNLDKFDIILKDKLLKLDSAQECFTINGEYFAAAPPLYRKHHIEMASDKSGVVTAVGPAGLAYFDSVTNNRAMAIPKLSEITKVSILDGVVYKDTQKLGALKDLMTRGRVSVRPRAKEFLVDDLLLCPLPGDFNKYKIAYEPVTGRVNTVDQGLISFLCKAYNFSPYFIQKQSYLAQDDQLVDRLDALLKRDIKVNLDKSAIMYKDQYIGRLPSTYEGINLAASGEITETVPGSFKQVYQSGMLEHFGNLCDVDHSTGMVYRQNEPLGTIGDLLSRGRIHMDDNRHTVLLDGHFFCPLPCMFHQVEYGLADKTGQVNVESAGALLLIHAMTCNTTNPTYYMDDRLRVNATQKMIYETKEDKTISKMSVTDALSGKHLTVDQAGTCILYKGHWLCNCPEDKQKVGIVKMDPNSQIQLDNQNLFCSYVVKELTDWRLLRMSGSVRTGKVIVNDVKNISVRNKIVGSLDSLMSQSRVWYDSEREVLLIDGCFISSPKFELMSQYGAEIDPTYGYVRKLDTSKSMLDLFLCSSEQLEVFKTYELHRSNLDRLTKEGRLTFDSTVGIISLDDKRVGYCTNFPNNIFEVDSKTAMMSSKGVPQGTVKNCFDQGRLIFEFQLIKAAQSFRENKAFLVSRSKYGSLYGENKGTIDYWKKEKAPKEVLEDMKIDENAGSVPHEIMLHALKEIKNNHSDSIMEKDIAKSLKSSMDKTFGRVWQVVVSRASIGCKVSHFQDMFIHVEHKNVTYILFRTPDYN